MCWTMTRIRRAILSRPRCGPPPSHGDLTWNAQDDGSFIYVPDTNYSGTDSFTYKAYDGLNNIFNLAYEFLAWKIHIALLRAKLEPYLGFLHSVQFGKPSLVCDFQELYRYLIDDFIIQHCRKMNNKDFTMKWENFSSKRKGKRQYLNNAQTRTLMRKLSKYFQMKVKAIL